MNKSHYPGQKKKHHWGGRAPGAKSRSFIKRATPKPELRNPKSHKSPACPQTQHQQRRRNVMPFFWGCFSTGCFLLTAISRLLKFSSVIPKLFPEVIYNMPRDKSEEQHKSLLKTWPLGFCIDPPAFIGIFQENPILKSHFNKNSHRVSSSKICYRN